MNRYYKMISFLDITGDINGLKRSISRGQGQIGNVIGFVAGVRGFSIFSKHHESNDIAMFIKRFHMRLMDIARPGGIVIDSNFMHGMIPGDLRDPFNKTNYIHSKYFRGKACGIFYLEAFEIIPESFLSPTAEDNWHTIYKTLKIHELESFSNLSIHLTVEPKHVTEIKVTMIYPQKVKGFCTIGYSMILNITMRQMNQK